MRTTSTSPEWVDRLKHLHLLTPIRVVVVIVLAIIATIVVRHLVSRRLSKIFSKAMPGDRTRAEARYRAMSSALRGALVGIIWTIAIITIVSEFGINVGALLATATVIGGTIAFGAQTMIRDVIAGFFVLADDQYGVGDQVDLGHAAGTVERVTLRGTRVRDGQGVIWHVSHGNVMRVGNLSKTSVAWLDLEVARTMTLDAVSAVAAELSQSLSANEVVAPLLLDGPQSVGIVDLRDDRMIHRTTVATRPGRSDDVKRAWRRLVLAAFERGQLTAPPTALATSSPTESGS